MSAEARSYLDSSALVKLVLLEIESTALRAHLEERPHQTSCALVRVEVVRAVRQQGPDAIARARRLLATMEILAVDDPLLDAAADVEHPALRSLDAIHVAAALSLGAELAEVVTYDRRMADAATGLGVTVVAPA